MKRIFPLLLGGLLLAAPIQGQESTYKKCLREE